MHPAGDAARMLTGIGPGPVVPFLCSRPRLHVMNGFLAAPAGNPYIAACFDEASRRLSDARTPVQALAGGYMMTDVALEMCARGTIGPVSTLSDLTLGRHFWHPVKARYKADHRNWRHWDRARLREGGS